MKKRTVIVALLALLGCAGEDYTPVYFPGMQGESEGEKPPTGADLALSQAQCDLELTAELCVQIKGPNLEVGTDPNDPLCAETPPIPLQIDGERILLRGRDFPDINVSVEVRGVPTPMTINGRGDGDGSTNMGEGSWTPEGDILIQGFSFFVNVLGMAGEIPNIDLTTDEAKEVPELPTLRGASVDATGLVTLVAAAVLGPLFPAADEFLLGASLQATFKGRLTPPLAECAQTETISRSLAIVKLRPAGGDQWIEEPLPEGNILEVSKGVMIAQSPQDTGPAFEEKAEFKAANQSNQTVQLEFPYQIGPFYFLVEGQTQIPLDPNESLHFAIAFRPDTATVGAEGPVQERLQLGGSSFVLSGVALRRAGQLTANQTDGLGQTLMANIETVSFGTQEVSAAPVRNYFRCATVTCNQESAITDCRPCATGGEDQCRLWMVNAHDRPLEEMGGDCRPLHPHSVPQMNVRAPLSPGQQILVLQNDGVETIAIQNIYIKAEEGSFSTGEFGAAGISLPLMLSPGQSADLIVTYHPKDLIGFDGRQAVAGQPAVDRAILTITTDTGAKKLSLLGRTQIEEVPELQAYFATPTGLKARAGMETFSFEEVTAQTQAIAFPVFFNVSETAAQGVRITDIKLEGDDVAFFEWLDSPAEVEDRQPPSGAGRRCSIPVFDPQTGRMIDERFDLDFVTFGSQGFDLKPGLFSEANLPLFGCVNFHRDPGQNLTQRIFKADLTVSGFQLDPQGRLLRNPDNTFRQTTLKTPLVAAVDPVKGKMVLRVSQTIAAILNPQAPSLTAVAAKREVDLMRQTGIIEKPQVLLGALILDPFDEMEITDTDRQIVSRPNDGVTTVFRAIDTRPTPENYPEDFLFDYATLLHDAGLLETPGIFYDYDEGRPLPENLKVNGWRIFTGALSYPGPLSPRSPITQGECELIDPCAPEGLRQFAESGIGSDGKGACAFFYGSGGRYHSPAFEPVIRGESYNLCDHRDQRQELLAMDTGYYSVDGHITFQDIGFRFWGPTYIHNPHGPLGFKPPLDEVFHIAFTTELLAPPQEAGALNLIPDEKVDLGRLEHKINLTDETLTTPPICPKNTDNRFWGGRRLSSWRYFAPLLFKDEAGEIPAGCPEAGNNFTGGTAFLKGRRLDPTTKTFTLVSVAKFGNREDLSLAFKNIMLFVALNGWVCDPQGSETDFEGAACFDPGINERDAAAQISIVED